MSKTNHKPNIAICIGNMVSVFPMLKQLCGYLNHNNINVHIFNSISVDYSGEPTDIGRTSIFQLPNYEMFDMLVIAPFFLSSEQKIIDSVVMEAKKRGVPIICVGSEIEGCFSVRSDYGADITCVTNHLIRDHNCNDIVFFSGYKNHDVSEERREGYKKALLENGLTYDEKNVYYGELWEGPTKNELMRMLDERDTLPQAIVCANDTMAMAVVQELAERNIRVPKDIMVTGMDGIDETSGFITTARLFSEKTGETVGRIINEYINCNKKPDVLTIVSPDIDYGLSCGCSKKADCFNEKKRHELFTELYSAEKYTMDTLKVSQELTNCTTYDEAEEKLYYVLSKVWANSLWVCVNESFMNSITTLDLNKLNLLTEVTSDKLYTNKGYGENMIAIASYRNQMKMGKITYPISRMLPDFYSVADEAKIILYTPLYFKDCSIGFIAMDFFPWSKIMYVLYILVNGISSMLESVRRQNELLAYARKVDELYVSDPLTTLYNRRGFFRLFSEAMANSEKSDRFMVISIDLDSLKQINDNYGHKEGDNAITVTANALKAAAKEGDICARFGGDEYVVFGKCENEDSPEKFVKKVQGRIAAYNKRSTKPYNVHASFGTCIMPADTNENIDYYLNLADSKMYVNKDKHKRRRTL